MADWVPTDAGEPADEIELADLDILGDLTHPLRGAIFRRLKQPHSAAELAESMDVPVTRLYHHLNRLEQVGVIRVVATRRVGAVTERRYQVTARSLRLSETSNDRYDPRELSQAMGAMYDFAKLQLQREVETGAFHGRSNERDSMLALQGLNLSADQREQLVGRLREVIDEFAALDDPADGAGGQFVLFVAAHPITD
ncbi:MAG TPA: helix-turn-helix domain-containing protein [Ilumatobacter sp.]|nr:helix-turn-helix domain-containing protein [Ilumatobacter sp.]